MTTIKVKIKISGFASFLVEDFLEDFLDEEGLSEEEFRPSEHQERLEEFTLKKFQESWEEDGGSTELDDQAIEFERVAAPDDDEEGD